VKTPAILSRNQPPLPQQQDNFPYNSKTNPALNAMSASDHIKTPKPATTKQSLLQLAFCPPPLLSTTSGLYTVACHSNFSALMCNPLPLQFFKCLNVVLYPAKGAFGPTQRFEETLQAALFQRPSIWLCATNVQGCKLFSTWALGHRPDGCKNEKRLVPFVFE
jgi:hypothetical protein